LVIVLCAWEIQGFLFLLLSVAQHSTHVVVCSNHSKIQAVDAQKNS